jgi:hypothetical protein
MGVGRTNPANNVALKEAMSTEQLIPRNNLSDLPDRATAISNLGITASAAELSILDGATATAAEINLLDGTLATVTIALTAGSGTDEMDITITAKDAAGATIAAVHNFEMWISDAATGAGLTANNADADMTADTGAIFSSLTAEKHWLIQTAATGIFVGVIADANNPADLYVCIKHPLTGRPIVSEATVAGSWEGGA